MTVRAVMILLSLNNEYAMKDVSAGVGDKGKSSQYDQRPHIYFYLFTVFGINKSVCLGKKVRLQKMAVWFELALSACKSIIIR